MKLAFQGFVFLALFFLNGVVGAGQDTLRIMTYNVLHYGDRCQGTNTSLHAYLKTIVRYKNPDVLGLVKAQVIKRSATDFAGISPVGFADSILVNGFNAAFPDRYDYCPLVNFSGDPDGDMDLLLYNKKKLGFLSVTNLCSFQEDFNLYKLYYKDPNLSTTKDSTFIYFILNHTVSGTSSGLRDLQDTAVVKSLRKKFQHLPNLVSMGDFNTHMSSEPGYQLLTATADTSFKFFDPPYFPDNKLNYPSDWQSVPGFYAAYLNTSTRETTSPNSCGSTGGAKGWYLHVLLSPWIIKNKNYIKYIPGSYETIGNDGQRVGLSINDSINSFKNTTVPDSVLNALFRFSDKYPIMVSLVANMNMTGTSLPDPDLTTVTEMARPVRKITINNPVGNYISVWFDSEVLGQHATMEWHDLLGRSFGTDVFTIDSDEVTRSVPFKPGVYILTLVIGSDRYSFRVLKK